MIINSLYAISGETPVTTIVSDGLSRDLWIQWLSFTLRAQIRFDSSDSNGFFITLVVFLVQICLDLSEFDFQHLQSPLLAWIMLFQVMVDVPLWDRPNLIVFLFQIWLIFFLWWALATIAQYEGISHQRCHHKSKSNNCEWELEEAKRICQPLMNILLIWKS